MLKTKIIGMLVLALLSAGTASAYAQPVPGLSPPKDGLTKGEAMAAFDQAMLIACLGSLEQGKSIADLTDLEKQDLRPAAPAERKFAHPKTDAAPVWTSKTLGSHLAVIETSPQRCDVRADQLPVEATFQQVIQVITRAQPEFHVVPQKPGYDPIIYQLEADKGGAHYIVHIEGAEPGVPFHAYRFSLLLGWVIRQP